MTRETFGSFSFDVTARILDQLFHKGHIKRTNLATSTGMNYGACVRYLRMIGTLGWIDVTKAGEVSITPLGEQVRQRLHDTSAILSRNDIDHNKPDPSKADKQGIGQSISWTPRVVPELLQPDVKFQVDKRRSNNLAATAPPDRKERTSSKTKATKEKYDAMIIDDEPEVALTFQSFLASTGRYSVKAFTESYSALLEFASRRDQYDLVVLDIRMPGINGLQLYQSLAAMNPSCRFMFVSSLDAAGELLSMFPSIRRSDMIRKPVGKQEFVTTADMIVSR